MALSYAAVGDFGRRTSGCFQDSAEVSSLACWIAFLRCSSARWLKNHTMKVTSDTAIIGMELRKNRPGRQIPADHVTHAAIRRIEKNACYMQGYSGHGGTCSHLAGTLLAATWQRGQSARCHSVIDRPFSEPAEQEPQT